MLLTLVWISSWIDKPFYIFFSKYFRGVGTDFRGRTRGIGCLGDALSFLLGHVLYHSPLHFSSSGGSFLLALAQVQAFLEYGGTLFLEYLFLGVVWVRNIILRKPIWGRQQFALRPWESHWVLGRLKKSLPSIEVVGFVFKHWFTSFEVCFLSLEIHKLVEFSIGVIYLVADPLALDKKNFPSLFAVAGVKLLIKHRNAFLTNATHDGWRGTLFFQERIKMVSESLNFGLLFINMGQVQFALLKRAPASIVRLVRRRLLSVLNVL